MACFISYLPYKFSYCTGYRSLTCAFMIAFMAIKGKYDGRNRIFCTLLCITVMLSLIAWKRFASYDTGWRICIIEKTFFVLLKIFQYGTDWFGFVLMILLNCLTKMMGPFSLWIKLLVLWNINFIRVYDYPFPICTS